MIRLFVKGPLKDAKRVAKRRDIPVKCFTKGASPGSGHVFCDAPCSAHYKVAEWYGSKESDVGPSGGRPGALLFFSANCPRGALDGTRKKKRRRR